MHPIILRLCGFVTLFAVLAQAKPACPNTLAFYNPNLRTSCYNATWFILPVPKSSVQAVVPYPLITPPFSDKTLFPTGFPANTHPVYVSIGYQNDIRMKSLQIPALLGANIYVPYTDRLRDGKTPFNYAVQIYIGGVDGKDLEAGVPAAVATLTGTTVLVGFFAPNNDAYAPIASNPSEFSAQVKQVVVPNPLSGPSVRPSAIDLDFITAASASSALYTERTFRVFLNQAQILTNLLCQRNTYYFNETFAEPRLRSGNATLYPPLAGSVPKELGGRYVRQGGLSASAEVLGSMPEGCREAAANVDPAAVM
ncbi:MAG: hypothetical protein Q9185_002683 [Variospora sp. 1 TL-2023]